MFPKENLLPSKPDPVFIEIDAEIFIERGLIDRTQIHEPLIPAVRFPSGDTFPVITHPDGNISVQCFKDTCIPFVATPKEATAFVLAEAKKYMRLNDMPIRSCDLRIFHA